VSTRESERRSDSAGRYYTKKRNNNKKSTHFYRHTNNTASWIGWRGWQEGGYSRQRRYRTDQNWRSAAHKNGVETTYKDPDDPGKDATLAQIKAYGLLFTSAREDRLQYHNDKFKTFRLIMGQYSPTMKQRIQATPEYKAWEDPEKCDVKSLLAFIEALVSGTEKRQYQPWVMQAQLRKLVETRQNPDMSLDEFAQNFEDQLAVF
jgi:hypothetical protein